MLVSSSGEVKGFSDFPEEDMFLMMVSDVPSLLFFGANKSPECEALTYSFASDIWSYGVTIYEAAMLFPPFRGSNICQASGPCIVLNTGHRK